MLLQVERGDTEESLKKIQESAPMAQALTQDERRRGSKHK